MSTASALEARVDEAADQIARLSRKLESVLHDRVSPAMADARSEAKAALHQAGSVLEDQQKMVIERVRSKPLLAVAIATGLGFLIGRIAR